MLINLCGANPVCPSLGKVAAKNVVFNSKLKVAMHHFIQGLDTSVSGSFGFGGLLR